MPLSPPEIQPRDALRVGPRGVDLRDLKLWCVLKLIEDPTRDPRELVLDFTDGFYGPAGTTIREYLRALE